MGVYIPALRQTDPLKMTAALHQLAQGGTNAKGVVTLNSASTSTVLLYSTATSTAILHWQPLTADAAAQLATFYCTGVTSGSTGFLLSHANNTSTDQSYSYTVHQ